MNKQDKKEIMNLIKYKKMLGERKMITYKDITYCVRPCSNMECDRNIKHLDNFETSIIGKNFSNCEIYVPVSQASFDNCENWREEDEPRKSD